MSAADPDLHARLVALLRERSVQHGSFTLASGRSSSYYIDARIATMSAAGLVLIGELGLRAIRGAGWDADLVGGLTMGADPVAYAIARASQEAPPVLDAFSVRKDAKGHGAGRRIEGNFRSGARVVVVEDVITTGQSALTALGAVRDAGGRVSGVLAVVDRDEGGRTAIEGAGVSVVSLVGVRDLGVGS
ncbi:MAG TPA: orotate phosphoribosyltransferase [Gemmatimonadales bacterium]|nr:orotate phosphoribosyltransferase [Gemmatimonadales bacterium]